MTTAMLLAWVLYIVVDGAHEVNTAIAYSSYEECMAKGQLLAMAMKVDLQITNHVLEPKCVKEIR